MTHRLEGIHHISAITADGPAVVDFYARVLGLRLVKQTVNQDDPSAYHLFFADEAGSPGADLTFFEYPGARRGSPGAGMVTRIVFRVAGEAALDHWVGRLAAEGITGTRSHGSLVFEDPEGLELELRVAATTDAPLVARHLEIPEEHALQGFHAVGATVADLDRTEAVLRDVLGFTAVENLVSPSGPRTPGPSVDATWEARGEERGGLVELTEATTRGRGGAGTVHHVAFSTRLDEQEAWQAHVARAGLRPTPVIDRFYFRSVYFREPGGILYELATMGPGFATDEPAERLGERLSLPPDFEHLRGQVERVLTPLPDATRWRPAVAPADRAG